MTTTQQNLLLALAEAALANGYSMEDILLPLHYAAGNEYKPKQEENQISLANHVLQKKPLIYQCVLDSEEQIIFNGEMQLRLEPNLVFRGQIGGFSRNDVLITQCNFTQTLYLQKQQSGIKLPKRKFK